MAAASAAETLVPGLVGLSLSLVGLFFFGRAVLRAVRARGWATAPGEVVSSEVVVVKDGRTRSSAVTSRRALVVYRYVVGAERFEARRITFGDGWDLNPGLAAQQHKRYPAGAPVEVRYDPARPSAAVLEPKAGWLAWLGTVGCGAMAALLVRELLQVLR